MEIIESGIRNPESGTGTGTGTETGTETETETETGTGTGSRTTLIKIEDVLMVLLTIITCSKNWTLHQFTSSLWSFSMKGK